MEENINNMMSFADMVSQSDMLKPLMDIVEQVMSIKDENLTDDNIEMITGMINGAITDKTKQKSINSLVDDFESQGLTRGAVTKVVEELKNGLESLIIELKPSEKKARLLHAIFNCFYEIFDAVADKFRNYSIALPFKLDEGAQVPTYAHESDSCADVYASQDALIKAHTVSNMVHTGLHIALPEGWQARLAPRSSTGSKTPLRLSNSIGIIDSKQEATQWAA